MESWRLLDDTEHWNPHWNLAVEESIAREVGSERAPNTLRFWRTDNAVIIGRFQDARLEANAEACRRYGTVVLRRFTGGGAVYHDLGNLNWAVSIQRNHPFVRRSVFDVTRTFETLSAGLTEGLRQLGLQSRFVSPNGVLINGNKISGTAGAFKWGTVFFHGTLLVSSDPGKIRDILHISEKMVPTRNVVRSVPSPMTTLRAEMSRDVSMVEVKKALRIGFERSFGVQLIDGGLTREETGLAHTIFQDRSGVKRKAYLPSETREAGNRLASFEAA